MQTGLMGWRGVFTLILLLIVTAAVTLAIATSATVPTFDAKGTLLVDPHENSKDILAVVLAPATLALGYWFGSSGTERAEEQRATAVVAERTTKEKLNDAQSVVAALESDASPVRLAELKARYPQAFGTRP
ncbi:MULTISPECIES: hypothetical protein [unclassified Pseudoclavibacter]|uniref:hypothetical protein n=1 Tax=unclassified Pseudoclavibacter TaxID=2615177 RepID=UPI001BA7D603|nr:hypothetical protein [Pseudoclavibacter sp. Marseille-Q4354]MBS3178350.1 hypothetical protein [Pseudoclavibacter sp. Marseille-Q4354]